MADHPPTRIFISYSRADSDFVDRLEADLRARGFDTWVDRRRLEGTHEWQPQIDHAVAECMIALVVLTPNALGSEYVRHEYQLASQLRKRIVTVLHKACPTLPPELAISEVQWVNFATEAYAKALRELVDGCQDSSFDQSIDSKTLYNQARDLEASNPERAVVLYQRLLNRDPSYFGGEAQRELAWLNQRLYPVRARTLRRLAEDARARGEYGAEAGALEALAALGDQDKATLLWAQEYLRVARQNSAWIDPYENIKHLVAGGTASNLATARQKLEFLWKEENAPYFRDPAGITPMLDLRVPPAYELVKERLTHEAVTYKKRMKDEEEALTQKQVRDKHATLIRLLALITCATPIAIGLLATLYSAIFFLIALCILLFVCVRALRLKNLALWICATVLWSVVTLIGVAVFHIFGRYASPGTIPSLLGHPAYIAVPVVITCGAAIGILAEVVRLRQSNIRYEHRLAEIETHYQHELANIARHYGSA